MTTFAGLRKVSFPGCRHGRAVDHMLLIEDRVDPLDRLDRQRGDDRELAPCVQADFGEHEELAPGVRPARRLEHRARLAVRLVEPVEAAVGIGLQDTGEAVEMALGMLAASIRGVEEVGSRRVW